MKVAIMGAGLSGLACAIRLEQLGIYPDIFEKRGSIGDRFVNGEVLLTIFRDRFVTRSPIWRINIKSIFTRQGISASSSFTPSTNRRN